MATGDIGQTILPPVASVLTVAIAWQAGLSFVIPFLVVIGIVIWITVPKHTPTESGVDDLSRENAQYILGELRQPTLVFMGVILFLYIGIWQTFSAFYPTYLIENKGLSATVASGLFGLLFAVGVVAKPLAGATYDRIGIRGSLPIVLGGSIIGFAILPVIQGFWPLVAVTVLISTMLGSGAITQSYLAETIPTDIQGTGLGAVRSTASTMGAMGPVLFGAVAERGYFDEGYVFLAVLWGSSRCSRFDSPMSNDQFVRTSLCC
jgi:ACS family hexuronate transporter-like MFS transporter